jgi:hypothetical protein
LSNLEIGTGQRPKPEAYDDYDEEEKKKNKKKCFPITN